MSTSDNTNREKQTRYGKIMFSNGRYEGQILGDLPYGKGTYYFKGGSCNKWVYKGDWNEKEHGQGALLDEKGNVRLVFFRRFFMLND